MKTSNTQLLAEIDTLEDITRLDANTLEVVKHIESLERKLEVISNRIDSFTTCFDGDADEVIEFLEELQELTGVSDALELSPRCQCDIKPKTKVIHNVETVNIVPFWDYPFHYKIQPYTINSLNLESITHIKKIKINAGELVKIKESTWWRTESYKLKELGEVTLYKHHMLNGNWLYAAKDLLKEHTELQGEQ